MATVTRPTSISVALAQWAAQAGHEAALVSCDVAPISFSQLALSISSVATQLANAGLRREDRIGLLVPPGPAGAQLVIALACNATLVPINPALTRHELGELARVSGLRALVVPSSLKGAERFANLQQGLISVEATVGPDAAITLEHTMPSTPYPAAIRSATESDVALLLRSSGTTGAPKLIPVTHGNLLAMASKLGSNLWFSLGENDRAACTLPLYYAAGLKTSLFVPLILGAAVALPPHAQALDLGQWLPTLRPTYLSVAPAALNAMVDRIEARGTGLDSSCLRFVMCAAAYLPEAVRLAAQRVLRVPILEFYGLSEAGVMAANPLRGPVRPGTVGVPAPGEVRVVAADNRPVAAGEVGQIVISGPTVTPGYVTTEGIPPQPWHGWVPTGDLGRIDADGYLTIVGRLKEVINRGGEKVFPYEIEKALLAHPAVLEAAAFGVPHPRLGESVAAAVMLKPGNAVSEIELKDFLAGRLADFKLPRRLHFVSELPRGATGKVQRSALSELHASSRHATAAPDRLLEWELAEIWHRLLGTRDIGVDDDFFEAGGDSLLATEMLVEVEHLTGRPYPASELAVLTIRHMADVIASGLGEERELVTQLKEGSGVPFFLCHGDYVGRGTYARRLASLLADDRPFFLLNCYAEQLHGRTVEAMADELLHALPKLTPSPVVLGGYCNGGLIAWQLAHRLRSRGVQVAHLMLIETLSLNARPALGALCRTRPQHIEAAWDWARRLGNIPHRAARAILQGPQRKPAPEHAADEYADADRAAFEMMSRYVPPRLDVDVTCFTADQGRPFDTSAKPWRHLAASVRRVVVPGTHHTVVVAGREALALAMQDTLRRVTPRPAAGVSHADGETPASRHGAAV